MVVSTLGIQNPLKNISHDQYMHGLSKSSRHKLITPSQIIHFPYLLAPMEKRDWMFCPILLFVWPGLSSFVENFTKFL